MNILMFGVCVCGGGTLGYTGVFLFVHMGVGD